MPAIFGRINNAGDRGVDEVRLTVTYYAGRGAQRKLLYQESHSVIVTPIEFTGFIRPVLPFVPGETRDFGFELVAPAQIQQQSEPSLTVGSMVFTQSKAPLPTLAIENLTPAPQPSAIAVGSTFLSARDFHGGAVAPAARDAGSALGNWLFDSRSRFPLTIARPHSARPWRASRRRACPKASRRNVS